MSSKRVLIALDSGRGVVYAPASGWDRIYLLWTFRNFRSLPQNVLNPRQRQLIGSLYREASDSLPGELADAAVVGTVEDFTPSLLPLARPAKARTPLAGVAGKKSAAAAVLDSKPFYARFRFDRKITLKVATAALVLVIAILAWHQLGAQPVVDSGSIRSVAPAPPAGLNADVEPPPNPSSPTAPTSTASIEPATSAPVLATPEGTAKPSHSALAASKLEPNDHETRVAVMTARPAHAHAPVADPPAMYQAAADQPRMQISGRPRKLVYPVCPETSARGKVSLQAVVDYDGAVSRVKVITGDRALAQAAVDAVRQWHYDPFSGSAPPQERETNITISFISNEVVAVSFPSSSPLSR